MVTEALTGQTQAVMQPTTVLALLEQSNIVFSAVFERVLVSWESELQKVYRTNRMYMNDNEYFVIIDANEPMFQEIAAADFQENFQIKALADPDQLTLKEKLAKAQASYQVLSTSPIMAMSPPHMRNAIVRYLEALDVENIDEIVPTTDMVIQLMQLQSQQQTTQAVNAGLEKAAMGAVQAIATKAASMALQDAAIAAGVIEPPASAQKGNGSQASS